MTPLLSAKQGLARRDARLQQLGLAGAVLSLATLFAGCEPSKPGNQTNQELINAGGSAVAQVCSSQETLNSLKSVIFDGVDIANQTPAINPTYKAQLLAGGQVTAEVPTLSSFDVTTKKVSCSAKFTFKWPNDLVNRLRTASPNGSWGSDMTQSDYSIQPQADGQGLVYSLDGPSANNVVGSVMSMLMTLAQSDAAAQAAAEAAKTPPPPAPSPTSDAPQTTGQIDNGQAGAPAANPPPQ